MQYQFYTCDVFTETPFGGNPLAVLPIAEGLSTQQMQNIAREFNYSETTFVLPAEAGGTCKVRIFTPTREVPFAGHPNIGTAYTLASIGKLGHIDDVARFIFEEEAGLVPIEVRKTQSSFFCELKAPETPSIGATISVELIATALSLAPDDIVVTTHQPQVASVGLPFVLVELKNRHALENARAYIPALNKIDALGIMPDIHAYIHSNDAFNLRTRMFAPLDGVPEDPATGSANCALVAMLSRYEKAGEGSFRWRIAQGVEMNRPSVLEARTEKEDGEVTGVWIAGTCVMISQGSIEVY